LEFRGIMGGFYRISEWIMRLSAINILWVVCSIPFFYLLLVAMVNPEMDMDMLKQSFILLGAVAPFTLIPASAAMFAVARKWVMGEEDVPLFKTYFRSYKENYKQSLLGGLIFLFLGFLLYINYNFYLNMEGTLRLLSLLFLTFSVLLIAAFINYLCVMVHFHMKTLQIVKNAIIMTLGQPISTVALLVTNGVIIYFSTQYTFLIPFFMGSLCATASFWYFNRGYQRIQTKAEAVRKKEEEAAEIENIEDTETDGTNEQTLK